MAQSSHVSGADGPQATAGSSSTPDYQLDRSEEDWSRLCRQANGSDDFWDPLKCIGLARPFWYVSFGAELRGSYEVYRNYNWGSGPQDGKGYYLNRLISHGDFHFGPSVRIFAELQSGLEFRRNGGPRPGIDEDKLDVNQLFLELRSPTYQHKVPIEVRVGRQNLNYGDGSLVSIRDLNVRRPFDGIKLILRPQEWRIDIFAAKPVVTSPGFFDDAPDHTQTFWGIWATDKKEQSFVRQLDFYYLGLDRKNAQFDQGAARERRNTLGVRAHETASKLAFIQEIQEGDLQLGTFGSGRLLAWKFADGLSYSLPKLRQHPTLELQGAISSGDKNPRDVDLQTFYPLFPSGQYYGDMVFTSGSLSQSGPTRALVCSYRRVSRSMSIASFYGDKERPMDSILKPACSCAQDRHRGRATWVQPRI